MQDPSNPNSKNQTPSFSATFRPSHHRRAHSEVNFRLPEDLDLVSDPFDASAGSFEEIGSEDDFFSTYMDIEKLGTGSNPTDGFNNAAGSSSGLLVADGEKSFSRPRHRHSNSVDSSSLLLSESIEAKKAMAPDKLAELWTIDPKRAKRILANRQSASRSKERKARYITELERKVQTLQTEATTLSAQLTLFQRDTTQFTNENTELKIRLQAMAQQAQLRDALNEALKQEVERLKMATGEMSSSDAYNLGMQHIPYNQSAFFSHQTQSGPSESQNIQMQQFHSLQDSLLTPHRRLLAGHGQALPDTMQQDPLGRFQGLDIGGRGMHHVKTETPSISASESSSTL
ncbi:transcription factor RF2b-like [Nicotiana tabacum]|uniref:Transcription factor RF2b-like n=1 Tax=Nicotiana tabacum TaxID=4097 RepID=A0A1S4B547_TOBAC|nr:transcription factor RF2b [Nicotiana tomentosiformis]XP_016484055.1 PREDICTED: transcription factor RF2b-like [Nicotiana tabacum]